MSDREKWKRIIADVDRNSGTITAVPISLLKGMTISLVDGSQINIKVQDLLDPSKHNIPVRDLEEEIYDKLNTLGELIDNIEYSVGVDQVAQKIQPITNHILRNIQ